MAGPLGDVLVEMCPNARDLVLVAPYMKMGALERVLESAGTLATLTCVTRWRPGDLAGGVSDVGCRAMVVDRGGSFRLHPTLHAKYYRVDDVVLIGSANLTAAAMGWSREPNLEILSRVGRNRFDAGVFEHELLREAREIDDGEFARWFTTAKIGVEVERFPVVQEPALWTWRPTTRDPENLELAYRGRQEEIASFDEKAAALRDLQALAVPGGLAGDALWAWIATCLLSTPFVNSVIRLREADATSAAGLLAESYGRGVTQARRDMEAVQNWLRFLSLW